MSELQMSRKSGKNQNVLCCAFSSTSEYLACGTDEGVISVWDIRKREQFFSITHHKHEQITSIAFKSDDSQIVAVTSLGYVHVVDFKQQVTIKSMQYNDFAIRTCKFSHF